MAVDCTGWPVPSTSLMPAQEDVREKASTDMRGIGKNEAFAEKLWASKEPQFPEKPAVS